MSFVIGPLSGALVAGGIYYGFSNLVESRTNRHREDLHTLSKRLITPPAEYDPPPPAAARIVMKPFMEVIKQSWNDKVGGIYALTRKEGERASSWGRRVLYGGDASHGKSTPSP
ncbi:hypothetical protein DFH94DRAFT_459432 [Russula ochroleuca]|jgi:altered-inheritance-of-mitochondria protein 5|uniref:MICOS complex subunit MIC12 n=1 Tax=Russula ochroleuca TaxID=152965 RepID=A0A9P5T8P1_9AGAM|nr:hypothetical protein DFH94DRAFT_459432 [Russula ochroleuca]